MAGYTDSFGAGNDDMWILKLDSSGNVSWQKTYGGSDYDDRPTPSSRPQMGAILWRVILNPLELDSMILDLEA